MNRLGEKIKSFGVNINFDSLGEFVKSLKIDEISYLPFIKDPENKGEYGRNICSVEPFECVLINWPAGIESAVHHHKGLFGYVLVLEGELDNISYRFKKENLEEYSVDRYGRGGVIPEPDGVIHKLRNNSKTERAITLHFYYPAIHSFEGMEIFNLEKGVIGILSNLAKTATWSSKQGHFKEIKENAFKFISFEQLNYNNSHVINYIIPKPSVSKINEMNSVYFDEQSLKYDFSDFNQPNRKLYIDSIDNLIAEGIEAKKDLTKYLDVATGTGRRATHIKELSKREYEIVGVDISEAMCKISESRGIRTYCQNWVNEDSHIGEFFDVISFLYAFGHIATESERIKTFNKIASYLKPDGVFYFDIFSLRNKNEWGGLVERKFHEKKLENFGYQKGDVFYRKKELTEVAFLHYFTVKEIEFLLNKCGFKITNIRYVGYSKNPGEIVSDEESGNIFIESRKINGNTFSYTQK